MSDRLTALRELLAKAEAGDCTSLTFTIAFTADVIRGADGVWTAAYYGSLDAAQALHSALLLDWPFEIRERSVWTNRKRALREPGYTGNADTPARAWVIAILKALIAKEAPHD